MSNPFATKAKTQATDTNTPVAEVLIKLGGIVVGSRSIWAESTSKTQAYNDLNEMAKNDPDALIAILKANVGNLTFEVRSNELNQGDSFEDIIGALK